MDGKVDFDEVVARGKGYRLAVPGSGCAKHEPDRGFLAWFQTNWKTGRQHRTRVACNNFFRRRIQDFRNEGPIGIELNQVTFRIPQKDMTAPGRPGDNCLIRQFYRGFQTGKVRPPVS